MLEAADENFDLDELPLAWAALLAMKKDVIVNETCGQAFLVRLTGCRTCGFEWQAPDVTLARLVHSHYEKPDVTAKPKPHGDEESR